MTSSLLFLLAVVLALPVPVFGLEATAAAQPAGSAPPPPMRERRREAREQLRRQVMDQMRTMRMWRITEELRLDEATAAKLFPLLSKYDDRERELGKERPQIVRELRQALDSPNPDGPRIDRLVTRLLEIRTRRQALEQEKIAAMRKILSPAQMGKLVLLLPRIEESLRNRIRDAIVGGSDPDSPEEGRPHFLPDFRRRPRAFNTPGALP